MLLGLLVLLLIMVIEVISFFFGFHSNTILIIGDTAAIIVLAFLILRVRIKIARREKESMLEKIEALEKKIEDMSSKK